jgi:hypothetical protein
VCRRGERRLLRRELLDADLVVDTRANWTAGPARPTAGQYDLETVLLHEMGHLAGNEGHVSRCRNSPMVRALDTGEWWRSPEDRHIKQHCGTATPANLRRVEHRTRRMPVFLPDGREGTLVERDLKRAAAARSGAGRA